jgi:hypothetical protein
MYFDCSLQSFQKRFLPSGNIHADEELNDKKQKQSGVSVTKVEVLAWLDGKIENCCGQKQIQCKQGND